MKYLIVGNGIAGVNAAEAIREVDQKGEIVMIGDETFPPYSRPMISQVLDGSQPHEKLPIRPQSFYSDLGITPILGARAESMNVDGKRIRIRGGNEISFDRLLIATGADPRPLKAEGIHLAGIHFMRTQAHVKAQIESAAEARKALVLGGGLVGFKAAYGLLKRGLAVTMLITSEYPLSMQVDDIAGKMILESLLLRGLSVHVGESVAGFEGNGRVKAAVTKSGASFPCELVVVGKGVYPAHGFIPKDQIKTDLGIIVDEHLETSVKGVYAAGDVAESTDIARNKRWVNAIWPEAAIQGRIAGFNMAGRSMTYPGSLGRNVIRVYDLDVMTIGHANPKPDEGYEIIRSGGPNKGAYRSLVFEEDRLIGAVLINRIEQGGVLRALIETKRPIDVRHEALLNRHFNIGRMLH